MLFKLAKNVTPSPTTVRKQSQSNKTLQKKMVGPICIALKPMCQHMLMALMHKQKTYLFLVQLPTMGRLYSEEKVP